MLNILPELNWKSIFNDAKYYDTRIGACEKDAKVEVIETLRREFIFPGFSEATVAAISRRSMSSPSRRTGARMSCGTCGEP